MNGKRSCWMMLIINCKICICLPKGTELAVMARIILWGVRENANGGVRGFAGDPLQIK